MKQSEWNGAPLDCPGLDDSQRRMWDEFDDFTTRRAWAEQEAVRERDANLETDMDDTMTIDEGTAAVVAEPIVQSLWAAKGREAVKCEAWRKP